MDWPPRFSARFQIALLVAIVALGAWLRWRSTADSLWLDELHTAWVAQAADWASLQQRAAMGNQSPLYYCGVAAIVRVLGPSELAMRLLSLVAGTLLPVACWGLARRLMVFDGQIGRLPYGLLAAWLVAVDPLAVFYSQEARPYACVQLAAALHVWLLVELLDRPTWPKRLGWIACGGLLFYLHYTAALVIGAEAVFVAGWLAVEARRTGRLDRVAARQWAGNLLGLIVLALPTLLHLREIYERRQNWTLFVDRVGLAELAELPQMIPWSSAAMLLAIAALVFAATRAYCASNFASAGAPSIWLLLCWLIVPIAVVAITSAADWLRLWHVRYLIGVTPAAFLLAAMLPRPLPPRFDVALALGLAVYAGWTSNQSLDWLSRQGRTQRTEDWKAAVAYLNEQTDRDPILLRSGLIEADALRTSADERLVDYCRLPLASLYPLNRPASEVYPLTMTRPGALTEPVRTALQPPPDKTQTCWLVVRGDQARAAAIGRELRRTFAPHQTTVEPLAERSFGRVQVHRLRLRTASDPPGPAAKAGPERQTP